MGVQRRLVMVAVALLSWYIAARLNRTPPLPKLDPNPWWGPGEPKEEKTAIRPFKIDVPKSDIDDLQARLALPPRIIPSMEGTNFTYGVNSVAMSVLLKYWKDNYDWKKREQRLNAYPHFKTRIEGIDIHFLRASPPPGSGKVVRPLLMVHGWPGSFVEFYDVIPLLTKPRPDSDVVFDVICPSLPGYGFSEASSKPGLDTLAMAQIFVKLMERLGFSEFYTQAGDWGATITTDMATVFPQRVSGLHLNMVIVSTLGVNTKLLLGSILPSGYIMDPALEKRFYPLLENYFTVFLRETGYAHIQATKPDTIGVALSSSPHGLAAYIFEKYSSCTKMDNIYKKDGGLLDPDFPISLDAMLDNICVYWFSGSITSSMRLYSESFNPNSYTLTVLNNIPTAVPTGIAAFVDDLLVFPQNLAAHKYTNIVTYSNPSRGGHFAAMEEPKLLADDIFKFVNIVEKTRASDQKQSPPPNSAEQQAKKTTTGQKKTAQEKPKTQEKPKKTK